MVRIILQEELVLVIRTLGHNTLATPTKNAGHNDEDALLTV